MKFFVQGQEFEIPDEWLTRTGMHNYTATSESYLADTTFNCIPLNLISRPARNPGIAYFTEAQGISILNGIKNNDLIPPIEIRKLDTSDGDFKYAVHNGTHRFLFSHAFGFTKIPVTIVDIEELRRFFPGIF
jgi:hypothetical protein